MYTHTHTHTHIYITESLCYTSKLAQYGKSTTFQYKIKKLKYSINCSSIDRIVLCLINGVKMFYNFITFFEVWGFPGGASIKSLPANVGDTRDEGSIPELGRSPGVGNDTLFQYSCLENPMDRGAWWAIVHSAAKIWTQLSEWALTIVAYLYVKAIAM